MAISENWQKIIDLLKELSVSELNEVVKALEEEFGVSAAAVAVWWGGAAWGEWQWEWSSDTINVELTEIGQQKISVIKVIKEVLWLGLKEAKEIVEKTPTIVKEWAKPEEWEEIKAKLEEAWATITLK